MSKNTFQDRTWFTCPTCNTRQKVWLNKLTPGYNRPRAIYCDIEQGGCDNLVVIEIKVKTEATPIAVRSTEVKND